MHHVAVALDDHLFSELHRAGLGDPADIVAAEVDQHQVLGDFLRVGQQVGFEPPVLVRRLAAHPGAGDRPHGDFVAVDANQNFRAGTDDVVIVEIQAVQIRRWIEPAQRPVQRYRRFIERCAHPLRWHHLHHVAGGDVVLDPGNAGLEGVFAEAGHERWRRARRRGRLRRNRLQQLRLDLVEPRFGARATVRQRQIGVDDQGQRGAQRIEGHQFVGAHQQHIGRAQRIRLGGFQARLEQAHAFVAEVADEAAGETRQRVVRRHPDGRRVATQPGDRIGCFQLLRHCAIDGHGDRVALDPDHLAGAEADERVAAPLRPAVHRFEQVGVWAVGQLQEGADRRIEVAGEFARQRDVGVVGHGSGWDRRVMALRRAQPVLQRRFTIANRAGLRS